MNEKDFAELSAGHALHALSPEEERRYADALREHPEWQSIAAADAETVAVLAETPPSRTPPPAIRDDLLRRIASTPQDAETPGAGIDGPVPQGDAVVPRSSPRRRSRLLFALAACLVLVVGIGAGAAVLIGQLQRPAAVVALERIENAPDAQEASVELETGGTATAHWSESVGSAVLVTDGLEPLAEDRTYELWYVRGDAPVSAGVFDVEDSAGTAVLEGEMQPGDAIAVTVEQAGGSPTGAPTTDPIIVIPTA
ncbi:anti-sigma factor domain-containing protein [Microbacterium sp. CIAB417]|uniref:anti-sigma factor n=1 Tax=Microbacterium sp. CIAB417 TaxID=2860287 RepID=UPI001FAD3E37|nr:anti-sigma factor [Microbacterium sp. CIAB417]